MTKINLNNWEKFENRHNSSNPNDLQEMLQTIGADSLEDLISQTIPDGIRLRKEKLMEMPIFHRVEIYLHSGDTLFLTTNLPIDAPKRTQKAHIRRALKKRHGPASNGLVVNDFTVLN